MNIPVYRSEDWLRSTYASTGSIYKMAEIAGCGCSTIHKWMKKYQIPMQGMNGRTLPPEAKTKISLSNSKRTPTMLGNHHSDSTKRMMSLSRRGCKNANWKGGITKKVRSFRRSKEYVRWVDAVINQANGRCEICGCKEPLEAHHIISLHKDFSKALDLSNGMALCHSCHLDVHGRKENAENTH